MNEQNAAPFTAADIRLTRKGGTVYAILLDWPESETRIASLAGVSVERVELLGVGPLEFRRDDAGVRVSLPRAHPGAIVPVLKLS